MVAQGLDMEALSPRDANAQRPRPTNELKSKAAQQLKANKEKEHPPPPPPHVTEPPSADRRDGAVYQVGKLLGKGGFAVCYDGIRAGTRERFALKIVKSKMPAKMEQKFQTELQIHSKMRHANIVQFFRAFSFESSTYLVLELCTNGSLMDMVKRRKGITEAETRFYAVQITGAVKYMHAKGIIHRDLKMGNIFLDKHMNAKVGDFGLAALLVTGKDMQTIRRTTLCGTPNYIAPEILEKGKGGHDHNVDLWSLGVIIFAMIMSKPPFQSSTTDEIYRRAKIRDYVWPETKFVSQEAKDLVAFMLRDADQRPAPDEIVQHPFFTTGYMPLPADMTSKLREVPPDQQVFYDYPLSRQMQAMSFETLKDMCRMCGVGPWNSTQIVHKPVWREMAAEETAGLIPVIPLAENIVYRPFEDWVRENLLQSRYASQSGSQTGESSSHAASRATDDAHSITSLKSSASVGLLRAPPQSFAAQQRAQGRPAPPPTKAPLELAEALPTSTAASSARASGKREIVPLANPLSLRSREEASKGAGASRPHRTRLPESRTVPAAERSSRSTPALARSQTSKMLSDKEPAAKQEKMSLFAPAEHQEEVPGSRPDIVLDRLRKLQAELERALNSRSMAIVSTKDKTPAPPQIVVKWVDYTNKFGLGYILNDGSVGCILKSIPVNDGPKAGFLPPACMLIHGAERHIQRKSDRRYADRHQIVPMSEGIYFYENNGEEGLSRVRVNPDIFRVSIGADGVVGKLSGGEDVYEHRKRERIVLWKKFANYMLAYGRELEAPEEETPMRAPVLTDPTVAPVDVVTFYQRFGDVGCWVFCDGHLQFNFPDHTKIVLDSTGTWCHFWHLPQDAAERLAATGSVDEASLDERSVLSYPLQTLLNFAVNSRPTASRAAVTRSASNSSRRRPEIRPELQGIPTANDFRRKVEFIRSVVREWVANGGIGNSDMSREGRLRWSGVRETKNVQIPAKHVWVTVGSRSGDGRVTAYFDPRKPNEIGPDLEEGRKASGSGGGSGSGGA